MIKMPTEAKSLAKWLYNPIFNINAVQVASLEHMSFQGGVMSIVHNLKSHMGEI